MFNLSMLIYINLVDLNSYSYYDVINIYIYIIIPTFSNSIVICSYNKDYLFHYYITRIYCQRGFLIFLLIKHINYFKNNL